jgi:hypothetical protein
VDENGGSFILGAGFDKVSSSSHVQIVISLRIETLLSGYKMIHNIRTRGGTCEGISLKNIPLCEGKA